MDTLQKSIKVCFISFHAYALFNPASKLPFGGAEVQMYLLSKALSNDRNYEVSFITSDRRERGVEQYGNIKVYKQFGVKAFDSPKKRRFVIPILLHAFLSFLYTSRKINADIYIQRCAGLDTGLFALICRLLKKRFIYMVAHEIDVSGEFVKRGGWSARLFSLGLKYADVVICQNQKQVELLQKNFDRGGIVFKTAYPIEKIEEMKKDFILWVARLDPFKQPKIFLVLAERFPDKHFVMVAPRSPAHPEFFGEVKKKASLLPNLTFIDYVPFQEIDEYFKKAKIFINTSTYEGFPNTFVQSAKNKTPIVSWKVNPEGILDKYRMGFCADGDMGVMVKQLRLLLEDKNLWHEFAENSYRYAQENHSIEKVVEDYKKLFRSLMSY